MRLITLMNVHAFILLHKIARKAYKLEAAALIEIVPTPPPSQT